MCMKTTKDVVIKQGKERDRQGDQSYISRNMVGLTKRCLKNLKYTITSACLG